MEKKIRILLVDDHQMILDSLQLLFGLIDGIEVVRTEHDSRNVLNVLAEESIDVLITDYRMPYLDGLQLTRMVREKYPSVKVLILSVNEDAKDIQDAFHAGAVGYIMKKVSRVELENAVKTVASGKLYFGQNAMQAMLSPRSNHEEKNILQLKVAVLTKRELEIVALLVDEMSSGEIAQHLKISTGTVETHRHNILRKLNVKSTIGVIKFAIKTGIAS